MIGDLDFEDHRKTNGHRSGGPDDQGETFLGATGPAAGGRGHQDTGGAHEFAAALSLQLNFKFFFGSRG